VKKMKKMRRKMGTGPIINDSDIAYDWRRKDG